jgi:tRNA-specific 2-thiouridylase
MRLPRFRPGGNGVERPEDCQAVDDARRVGEALGIPVDVKDCREEFERLVVAEFCDGYRNGRTPNPCVRCNELVKFGELMRYALDRSADVLATGHYVRKATAGGDGERVALRKGAPGNDQSYFLCRLTQDQLECAEFPLDGLSKAETRAIARDRALPVHDSKDSQDLCFVPDGDYRDFLRERCPTAFAPGLVARPNGEIVGEHDGIGCYTIGQRKGLRVGHRGPFFVLGFRPEENLVIVGERGELMRGEITVEDVNWLSVPAPRSEIRATVKIRYNHEGVTAQIAPRADGAVRVRFGEPQEAPTPGQAAVFYDGDLLLGGGTIADSFPLEATP